MDNFRKLQRVTPRRVTVAATTDRNAGDTDPGGAQPVVTPASAQKKGVPALLWHFMRHYPRRTSIVAGLLTLAGFAEGVSVLALLPFIQVALAGNIADAGAAVRWVAACLGFFGLPISIGALLLLIIVGVALKAVMTLVAMKEVGYAVSALMTDLRQRLIEALINARWSYFVAQPVGLFANAISSETSRAGTTYRQSARLAAAAVQACVYGIVTFIVSWKVALFAICAGLAGVVLFRRVISLAMRSGERETDLTRSLSVRTTDALQGIKAIKAMAAERSALPLISHEIGELDVAQRQQVWSIEVMRVAQEPLLVACLAIAIYGAIEVGGESLSALMVIAALFYRLFNRIQVMQEIYQQIGVGASAYWAILRLCQQTERESERRSSATLAEKGSAAVGLDAVGFGYTGSPVLSDLSLRIEPGEFIAISGPSGGGKTTLLDLISGLLQPSHGRVTINGQDLANTDLRSWRSRIGYVPQEMLLLHDTIYRNVSLDDASISRAVAEQALRQAGVWGVVSGLPEGIDTVVGERGGRFSGGQRQRISLARALARRPDILLLDEITAALDRDTERDVCATLRALAGTITIIAVSHQAEMVRVADRTIYLRDGRLVEQQRNAKAVPATDHV